MKLFKSVLKERFDYDVSAIGSYVDAESEDVMTNLLYSSGLTSRVTVMEEVKGSEKIKLLNLDFALQSADDCTLEDDGTVTFTNKTIATERVGVQFKLCNETLNGTWAQMLLAIGANRQDRDMPLEDVITAYTIKLARKKNQDLLFNGNTLSLDEDLNHIDGYVKLLDGSATVIAANRTGTTITSSNAFENALSVYNAIPAEVFDNEIPCEMIMSRTAARAIIDQVWNDKDYNARIDFVNEGGELSFVLPSTDITVRSYPQLGTAANVNKMYAVPYRFMIYGTDLENDVDGFFVRYLESEEYLRFGAKWRVGAQIVWEEYFVRLANTAS